MSIEKIRDYLAEENYPMENVGHLSDSAFYERAGRHDGFKLGFDTAVKLRDEHWRKIVEGLVEALEKLRADYQFGNGQVYEDIEKALNEYRKQIGSGE